MTAALDQKATFDELSDLLDEMLAETGGPTTAVEEKLAPTSAHAAFRP